MTVRRNDQHHFRTSSTSASSRFSEGRSSVPPEIPPSSYWSRTSTQPRQAHLQRGRTAAAQGPAGLPAASLSEVARAEWDRVAGTLHEIGVLTTIDRPALAAYCQAYGRGVEAEEQMKKTPAMLKTPSGYVQRSPWMSVANKQLELMGRYMTELGMTPAARSRVQVAEQALDRPDVIGNPELDENSRAKEITIVRQGRGGRGRVGSGSRRSGR